MDTRQLLAEYMEQVINSKDEKERVRCFLFLEGKIQESEGETKETFIKMRDRMRDYFNKNIQNG